MYTFVYVLYIYIYRKIYICICVIQGRSKQHFNILIKIFQLLPLSIHVNIYNLCIVHKII